MSTEAPAIATVLSGGEQQLPARRGGRVNRWVFLVIPALLFAGVFFGYPVAAMFVRSVTDFTLPGESGLDNFRWLFGSSVQRLIFERTLLVALGVTGVCLLIGFPYAYLMTVVSARWRLVMVAVVLMPFWTSMVVRTYSWVVLLQDGGPLMRGLDRLGIAPDRLLGTTTAVLLGSTQVLLPFMILPLYTGLARIDRSLLLAAHSLGAPPRRAFVKVYLPLAVPGMLAGSTIVFILSLGFYFTPALLGSPQNSLVSQQIVEQVTRLFALGRGGALAFVLLLVTLVLLGLGSRLAARYTRALEEGKDRG
ncbi:ABC transporter permease [Marmoricola sp. RAF53]